MDHQNQLFILVCNVTADPKNAGDAWPNVRTRQTAEPRKKSFDWNKMIPHNRYKDGHVLDIVFFREIRGM